ncbi:hypothetical protein [Bradyrhizobium sp. McL0615]|uniref:hypothetical protein n=1 Tax=Bradyrhizobium sp. McL0615 TaxID=3415673 RepID=UPI003CF6EDE6
MDVQNHLLQSRRIKFDNIDINAEVFVQARASFEMFDRLTQGADPPYWIAQGDQPTTRICPTRPARHWDAGRFVIFSHTPKAV